MGLVAGAVGLVIGWRVVETAMFDYVSTAHATMVTPDQVDLVAVPEWLGESVQYHISSIVSEQVSPDPLDGKSLHRAVRALELEPWVQRIDQVQRLRNGRIEVHAAYRKPVAVVAGRAGYHLVGDMAVRLPGLYVRNQVRHLGLPVIAGVSSAPPQVGQVWPGQDLRAGLGLIELLVREPYVDQILVFDVGHRDERGRVRPVLHTERGRIHWGFPPGQERSIEPDALTKRRRLRQIAAIKNGRIDAGGQIVSIYGPVIQTQPLNLEAEVAPSSYTFDR